ncbi:ABC transporter ATP-binding protein [Bacillus smithii]|uniref:ABC transporter ATP-binding protein n=1 Tax=Bacillus smithii TaxID=1479 RepID=UPI003D1CCB7E
MFVVQNISKKYKHHVALAPMSFEADSGDCVVLCGGNGAGKSTLIDMLSGISIPSSGTVSFNELSLEKNRKEYLSQISYMPDDFFAQGHLKVKEFLSFYGSLRKIPANRIDEVLSIVGLLEKKNIKVNQLSKGMRQRLLFGQALLPEAKVILLDEPTNGLDPYWINQFVQIMKKLKEQGTIIIFSTHMMDVAAELGDRIIFLESGKVVKELENPHDNVQEFTFKLLTMYREMKGGPNTVS